MINDYNRITYRAIPSFWDLVVGNFSVYWKYNQGFRNIVLTFFVIFLSAVLITEGHAQLAISILCFILGMWSMACLHIIKKSLSEASSARKMKERSVLDEEKGLLCDTDQKIEIQLGWKDFIHIKETRRFFFFLGSTGVVFMIVKKTLPNDTIDAIREMLRTVPVDRKYLRKP